MTGHPGPWEGIPTSFGAHSSPSAPAARACRLHWCQTLFSLPYLDWLAKQVAAGGGRVAAWSKAQVRLLVAVQPERREVQSTESFRERRCHVRMWPAGPAGSM